MDNTVRVVSMKKITNGGSLKATADVIANGVLMHSLRLIRMPEKSIIQYPSISKKNGDGESTVCHPVSSELNNAILMAVLTQYVNS